MKLNTALLVLVGLLACCLVFVFVRKGDEHGQSNAEPAPFKRTTIVATTADEKTVFINVAPKTLGPKLDYSTNSVESTNHAEHWVKELPAFSGSIGKGAASGTILKRSFEVNGTIANLNGAFFVGEPAEVNSGGRVVLEVSVQSGTLRAYLLAEKDGYVFVEVTKDNPGMVNGFMGDWSNNKPPRQDFYLESRDGEVKGIAFRIYRR